MAHGFVYSEMHAAGLINLHNIATSILSMVATRNFCETVLYLEPPDIKNHYLLFEGVQ